MSGPEHELVIRGGTVVTADSTAAADVGISDGRIVQVGGAMRGERSSTPAEARPARRRGHARPPLAAWSPRRGRSPWADDFASGSRAAAPRRGDHDRQHHLPAARRGPAVRWSSGPPSTPSATASSTSPCTRCCSSRGRGRGRDPRARRRRPHSVKIFMMHRRLRRPLGRLPAGDAGGRRERDAHAGALRGRVHRQPRHRAPGGRGPRRTCRTTPRPGRCTPSGSRWCGPSASPRPPGRRSTSST